MNIVVIDDEQDSITACKEILEALGNNVRPFNNLEVAYNFIAEKQNKWRIDLLITDEDFTYNPSSKFNTGADLCRILSVESPLIPIVMITGKRYDAQKAVQILGDYGCCYFYHKEAFDLELGVDGLKKIVQLASFSRIRQNRSHVINEEVRKFLLSLSKTKIQLFKLEVKKGKNANWSNKDLQIVINSGAYTFYDLLSDTRTQNINEPVNKKVSQVLDKIKGELKFSGGWNLDKYGDDKYGIIEEYNSYRNTKKVEKEKIIELLNETAFNYLLNVIYLKDLMNGDAYNEEKLSLNPENNKISVTNSCKTINREGTSDGFRNFSYKLIGRRVALGFCKEVGFTSSGNFQKKNLAALLQKGNVSVGIEKKTKAGDMNSIKNSAVFSTHLGLFADKSNHNSFMINDETVMEEEVIWISIYAAVAMEVRLFLDEFEKEILIKIDTKYCNPNEPFFDFNDFKKYYLTLLQNIEPAEKNKLGITIDDYLQSRVSIKGRTVIHRLLKTLNNI